MSEFVISTYQKPSRGLEYYATSKGLSKGKIYRKPHYDLSFTVQLIIKDLKRLSR